MANAIALTELLGAPVFDTSGALAGRVREAAVYPPEDRARINAVIVRTRRGDCIVAYPLLQAMNGRGLRVAQAVEEWTRYAGAEGLLLLGRDLLDQQVIDINGRKVVRVNDVELLRDDSGHGLHLRIASVDVGPRGAVRRLLRGVVPTAALRALVARVPAKSIPWEFIDLVETDPARRVRLKISHERLARLHPADIADILEELAPAERGAIFETLDEEVAADALEEIDPKLQVEIVNALDSERAADIVEEMNPDAAADLLADLAPERSDEILGEMEPEERQEVAELLEFEEDTAAGRMTTDYIALTPGATVENAIEMLRSFEGGVETLSTIFLVDEGGRLVGAVPLARIALAPPGTPLPDLAADPLISCPAGATEKQVAELFDKYNLLTLPVVDDAGLLTGVITADDIISLLRSKL